MSKNFTNGTYTQAFSSLYSHPSTGSAGGGGAQISELQSPYDINMTGALIKSTNPAILVIDSADRNTTLYPSPNKYSISFISPYKNVTAIELVHATIPSSGYSINATRNTIHFQETDGGAVLLASIESGDYTATQLVDAVETAMNNISESDGEGSTYSVSFDTKTSKITIEQESGSGYLKLLFAGQEERVGNTRFSGQTYIGQTKIPYRKNTIAPILGFSRSDLSGSASYTGQYSYNLRPDKMIALKIKGMERVDSPNPHMHGSFAVIPFNDTDDDFVYKSDGVANDQFRKYFSEPMQDLREVSIEFIDRDGNLYDFNGKEHLLIFEIVSMTRANQYA